MSCGVGCRRGLDPVLLWCWYRSVATALIRPLAWETPYATGVALEKTKGPKRQQQQQTNQKNPKSLEIINAKDGVKEKEPSYTVSGNVNWYRHYGEQY